MKLAAIYNVWDGVELLRGSMNSVKKGVDLFIIVYQDVSNFGETFDPFPEIDLTDLPTVIIKYNPTLLGGGYNEIIKRNLGLDIARKHGCTHFLHMDCDEYYEDFESAKQEYIASGKNGSVCKMYTYFKHPTWRFENPDNYYVPFIHRLAAETKAGPETGQYPFYCDPTRKINTRDVAELETKMHHFSWVRENIKRKARNSSARVNIERSQLLQDYYSEELQKSPEGYYVKDFYQAITVVPDIFKIKKPDF